MSIQLQLLLATLALAFCGTAASAERVIPFSRSSYEADAKSAALVLLSANWNRRWKCGAFENAQLQSLGFDRAGSTKEASNTPDILIEDSSLLSGKQGFTNFALLVRPGEYLLSTYKIKAAKSVSDIVHFSGDRTTLVSDGKSKAGSFTVDAGEVVYIGHFALDCAQSPMPWRYYPEDKGSFTKYLEVLSSENAGLPTEQAKFRLFDTTVMGNAFRLPE